MTREISEGSRPANRNILYNLATIYNNEPKESKDDSVLRSRRTTWNRWAAAALAEDQRALLITTGFTPEDIEPLSPEEKTEICSPEEPIEFLGMELGLKTGSKRYVLTISEAQMIAIRGTFSLVF